MDASKIRNVAILGHQSSGKTTLVESIYATALGKPKGTIEKGSTISDYLPEEKARLSSVRLSIVPVEYNGYKVNLIDIPGNDDFIGEAISTINVVKGAILVIDAASGVEVETVKHWNMLRKKNIPTIIFVNKMDKDDVHFGYCLVHAEDRGTKSFLHSSTSFPKAFSTQKSTAMMTIMNSAITIAEDESFW